MGVWKRLPANSVLAVSPSYDSTGWSFLFFKYNSHFLTVLFTITPIHMLKI